MEDSQTQASTYKLEVVQMLGVDARGRIDLEGIVIMSGIFKETVEGIEHFMGQEEEEFSDEKKKSLVFNVSKVEARQLTSRGHHNPDHLHHQT